MSGARCQVEGYGCALAVLLMVLWKQAGEGEEDELVWLRMWSVPTRAEEPFPSHLP